MVLQVLPKVETGIPLRRRAKESTAKEKVKAKVKEKEKAKEKEKERARVKASRAKEARFRSPRKVRSFAGTSSKVKRALLEEIGVRISITKRRSIRMEIMLETRSPRSRPREESKELGMKLSAGRAKTLGSR